MPLKHKILAVHDANLDEFLRSLELYDALENGELRCNICECQVTRENLGCVYPLGDEIKVCCDRLDCLRHIAVERRD